jgi:hypothetical protein
VVVPVPVAVPEPVVAVVAVVAVGAVAVDGPAVVVQLVVDPVVADPRAGAVEVVSFVAVVFVPGGTTTTGCLDGSGLTAQERIRGLTPRAAPRSSAAGGRQPGIAPRTARPRTRRT